MLKQLGTCSGRNMFWKMGPSLCLQPCQTSTIWQPFLLLL